MPAIVTASNPISAVATASSSSTTGAGRSSSESGERPFAKVLAEKSDKAASGEKAQDAKSSSKSEKDSSGDAASTTQSANGTDSQAASASTPPADATTVATPLIPADIVRAITDALNGKDEELQSATELIQAVLAPVAAPVDSTIGKRASVDTTAVTTGENTVSGAPLTATMADMRLAVARDAAHESAQDAGALTAKLAAAQESTVAEAQSRTEWGVELKSATPDAGLVATAAVAANAQSPVPVAQTSRNTEYRIDTPVGSRQWETSVGNSLVMMSGSGRDRAELVLTPPQLGRIEVSISMKGDEASAVFVAASPATREALENALPRLREVMADAGITLGQAQVGAESQGQSAAERQTGDNAARGALAGDAGNGETTLDAVGRSTAAQRIVSRSLVDTYA